MSAITAPLRRVPPRTARRPPLQARQPVARKLATRRSTGIPVRRHDDQAPAVIALPVDDVSARGRFTFVWLALMLLLFAVSVFGVVALNAMAAASAVEAREFEQRLVAAEREYGHLVAQVSELEDPIRIRELATDMGMIRASTMRTVNAQRPLPSDGSLGAAGGAASTNDSIKSVLSMGR
ncbi:MAG: hypothetical protein WD576_02840 [Nitriliruptoraceae bacterium]